MTREARLIDHIGRALWIGAGCYVADYDRLPPDVLAHYRGQARNAANAFREFERLNKPRAVK